MFTDLSDSDRQQLLEVARESVAHTARGDPLPALDLPTLPPGLSQVAACFVTINKAGKLRGCVGTLEAENPLVKETQLRAQHAASRDPRFPPVTPDELSALTIEVSVLTPLQRLHYATIDGLLAQLRRDVDGVVLQRDVRRATFLPQVWKKLPDPDLFLDRLCEKMGLPAAEWRLLNLDVYTYQTQSFEE